MNRPTVRELYLKSSEYRPPVAKGESSTCGMQLMPDREALIMSGPTTMDSGLILEQDRT